LHLNQDELIALDKQFKARIRRRNLSRGEASSMGIRQGVAMDSLKFHPAPHAQPFYVLRAGTPGTASRLFQGWPASIFYPFGQPTPYAYGKASM
jgi:hypothetical protein